MRTVAEQSEIECVVESIKEFGLSLCADLDGECMDVPDHDACWMHELGTGTCPFLCIRR